MAFLGSYLYNEDSARAEDSAEQLSSLLFCNVRAL